jgi:hypothetical protein
MAYDQNTFRILYKKLLNLYPREFRERLGESMEQTFNDLYQERRAEYGLFGDVLWMFIETTVGIVQEHLLLIKEMDPMKKFFFNLRLPAIVSSVLVIPFMFLEWVNRRNFNEGFPIPLFVVMWLLPLIFVIVLIPVVRNVRAGSSLIASPASLLIRIVILVFIAWMWTVLLIDQMPCFLGVPNCD